MDIKDVIIAPILIFLLIPGIWIFRNRESDLFERQLVNLGISVKMIGALAIGLIYQFYYHGGDTYNFFHHSTVIWKATLDNPLNYIKLAFSSGQPISGLGDYISSLYWYRDQSSFFVAKTAAFFGLFTLNSYLAIALCFSIFSFSGSWALYKTMTHRYPNLKIEAAIASFFIPSCIVWGSGLMKDTLTFGALGWVVYGFYHLVVQRNFTRTALIGGIIGLYIIYVVKIYILISLIPCLLGWAVLENLDSINSRVIRSFVAPFFFVVGGLLAFFFMDQVAEENAKYDLDNLALTSQTTAYDIAYWTGKGAGSTYNLGELDGTIGGIISLTPQAIVVSLFRPWLWEVSNPMMLITALESLGILILTVLVFFRGRLIGVFSWIRKDPFLVFCFAFSLVFAIGVGVSSYNFGSLARYKIPLMPFYVFGMFVLNAYNSLKRD